MTDAEGLFATIEFVSRLQHLTPFVVQTTFPPTKYHVLVGALRRDDIS